MSSSGRLLTAVLSAMSCLPSTCLTDVLPAFSKPTTHQQRSSPATTAPGIASSTAAAAVSMADDNHAGVLAGDAAAFPLLVGHMLHQTDMELAGKPHAWTFHSVLDRLVAIAGNPVRHALGQVLLHL